MSARFRPAPQCPVAMADLALMRRLPITLFRIRDAMTMSPSTQAEDATIARLERFGMVACRPAPGLSQPGATFTLVEMTQAGRLLLRRAGA